MKQISYHTYAYLKNILQRERDKAHQEYVIAVGHIPDDKFREARDAAWSHYTKVRQALKEMEDELHDACKAVYRDSSPEMKAFWGVENE